MNRSFSKKRHIVEVNSRLEERYLKEQSRYDIGNEKTIEYFSKKLTEQSQPIPGYNAQLPNQSAPVNNLQSPTKTGLPSDFVLVNPKAAIWFDNSRSCVTNNPSKEVQKLKDGSFRIIIGDKIYYSNFRVGSEALDDVYYWYCENGTPKMSVVPRNNSTLDSGGKNASTIDSNRKSDSVYNDCSKSGIYKVNCKDSRPKEQNEIMKIQGCLGVKPDGYFGKNTLRVLKQKYPNLGGVVKTSDINLICQSQISAVGLSGDNDMDSVPGNTPEPKQVTPVQQINKIQPKLKSQINVPAPQLSQQTIQRAGLAAQMNPTLRPK